MNSFKESLKVEINPEMVNKNLSLIMQYIETEMEENIEWDKEDGIDVTSEDYTPEADVTERRLINLLNYRNIRTKQAFLAKLNYGRNTRKERAMMSEIDKDRREKHNLALISLRGLVDFAKKHNLEPIYTGPMLSEEEIESHSGSTYDTRMEMTDAFLQILIDLQTYTSEICSNKDVRNVLNNISNQIHKSNRDYGVKKELTHDDGDIIFESFDDDLSL